MQRVWGKRVDGKGKSTHTSRRDRNGESREGRKTASALENDGDNRAHPHAGGNWEEPKTSTSSFVSMGQGDGTQRTKTKTRKAEMNKSKTSQKKQKALIVSKRYSGEAH